MKNAFIVSLFMISSAIAHAATIVSLPSRRVALSGDGAQAAMYDLSAELKKQKIGTSKETGRLVQVDVKFRATFTGATLSLLSGGVAVDSSTVDNDQENTVSLSPGTDITAAPWILAVRGDVQISELRVTVDAATAEPAVVAPIVPTTPNTDQPLPIQPTVTSDLTVGQDVIAVSSTSGRIEPVQIARIDGRTYTVLFDGQEYSGWSREQLAIMSGCANGLCVGQAVRWSQMPKATDLRVIGLLPGNRVVVESLSQDQRVVADASALRKPDAAPAPVRPAAGGRWTAGQTIYYIEKSNRVRVASVARVVDAKVVFRLEESGEQYTLGADSDRLAQTSGCVGRVCVGQQAVTSDASGTRYNVTVVGLQSNQYAVIQVSGRGTLIGNWPIEALRR